MNTTMFNELTAQPPAGDSNSSQPMEVDQEKLVISEKGITEPTNQNKGEIEPGREKKYEPELEPQCNLQRIPNTESIDPIPGHDSIGDANVNVVSLDSREMTHKPEKLQPQQLQFEHRSPPKSDRRGSQEQSHNKVGTPPHHQGHLPVEADTRGIHRRDSIHSQEPQLSAPSSQEPLAPKSPTRNSFHEFQSSDRNTPPNTQDAVPSTGAKTMEHEDHTSKFNRENEDIIMADRRASLANVESNEQQNAKVDDMMELEQSEPHSLLKSKRLAEILPSDGPATKGARTKRDNSKRAPKVYPPRKPRIRPVSIEPLTMTIRTDSALSTLASAAAAIKDGQGRFTSLSAPISPSAQGSQEREDNQDSKDSQISHSSNSPDLSQETHSSQTQVSSLPSELPSTPSEPETASPAAPAVIPAPESNTVTTPRLGRAPSKVNSNAPHDASGYRCELCPGERFGRVHDLKRHQTSKHNEMTWPCDFCHRPFVRRDALLRHYSVKAARHDGVHPTEQEENRLQEAKARAKLHS